MLPFKFERKKEKLENFGNKNGVLPGNSWNKIKENNVGTREQATTFTLLIWSEVAQIITKVNKKEKKWLASFERPQTLRVTLINMKKVMVW